MKATQKKLPKSQLEIEFELTEEEFKHFIERSFEHLKKHVKIDGFRPGQAPNKLVEDKINKESLLMEAGDIAVRETYSKYVLENKLEPVGQPEVSIIKIAQGSPFIFRAVITVLPDVELPDYKEIAKKVKGKEISVTEQEIQDSINYLQKTRAKFSFKNEPAELKDFVEIKYQNNDINNGKEVEDKFILGEAGFVKGFEEQIIGMRAGEEKEFTLKLPTRHNAVALGGADSEPVQSPTGNEAGDLFKVKIISAQKMELPEINDEFAKQLGAFDTLIALKASLRERILMEKTEAEKQRKRGEILEKIAEKSKFEMPGAMVEYEKERLLQDLKNRIAQNIKISFEEYLASIKKTEQELKETFKKEAEKRLRGFLVLRELGKKENIEVSDKEIEDEISKVDLAKIDIEQLKEYTQGVIQNEKIFKKLECQ